jgi:uncharacterized protein YkwD
MHFRTRLAVRNRMASMLVVVVMAVAAAAAIPASAGAVTVPRLINKIRLAHGLRPLRFSPALSHSSHGWAGRMMRGGFFAHAYHTSVAHEFHIFGENIGITFGRTSPARIVRMWMHSPEHRRIILMSTWRHIGSGSVGGVWRGHHLARTWVLRFGT